mmetsp:Transcript_22269/g.46126  ORF Transcript_22269/g.46126 Transcript_22269/m.46126 type:complete len:217 (+) Transcript_22269:564-1214(+)
MHDFLIAKGNFVMAEARAAMKTFEDRKAELALSHGADFSFSRSPQIAKLFVLVAKARNQPIPVLRIINGPIGFYIGQFMHHYSSTDSGFDFDEFVSGVQSFPLVEDRTHALKLIPFDEKRFSTLVDNRKAHIGVVASNLVKLHCVACECQPCDMVTTNCDFEEMTRMHMCHQKTDSKDYDPSKAMEKGWDEYCKEMNKGGCKMCCQRHHDDLRGQN